MIPILAGVRGGMPGFPPGGGGGGGATVVFQSDWGTGLGATDAALRDTNQAVPWPRADNDLLEVVDPPTEGLTNWPSGLNALRVRFHTSGTSDWCRIITADDIIPVPAIGEWQYFHFWHWLATPDGTGFYDSQHIVEQNDGGWGANTGNWVWVVRYDSGTADGKFRAYLQSQGETSNVWIEAPAHLDKGVPYLHEFAQQRVSETGYKMFYRISNAAGTIIHDTDGMVDSTGTLVDPDKEYDYNTIEETQQFQMGVNGFSNGGETYPFIYCYYGDAKVGLGDAAGQWLKAA